MHTLFPWVQGDSALEIGLAQNVLKESKCRVLVAHPSALYSTTLYFARVVTKGMTSNATKSVSPVAPNSLLVGNLLTSEDWACVIHVFQINLITETTFYPCGPYIHYLMYSYHEILGKRWRWQRKVDFFCCPQQILFRVSPFSPQVGFHLWLAEGGWEILQVCWQAT